MNEKLPELREVAKNLYLETYSLIEQMYEFVGDNMSISKDDVLKGYDHYLQSILLSVAISDHDFDEEEIKFVKNMVKDDLFKEYDFNNLPSLQSKTKEIKSIANEHVQIVPQFVELSVLANKKVDSLLKVMDPTYCQMIYDSLRRILMYFNFVDGVVEDEEEVSSKDVLKPIVAFYKKKYVKYAPKRKEN